MVRARLIQIIRYGNFREALEVAEELNRVYQAKGLRASTFWAPVAGVSNEFIIETDFPTLADFESDQAAIYADAEVMKLVRSFAQYVIEGTGRSELIESAPSLS